MHKLKCGICKRFISWRHPQGTMTLGNGVVVSSTQPFVLCSKGHIVFIGLKDC